MLPGAKLSGPSLQATESRDLSPLNPTQPYNTDPVVLTVLKLEVLECFLTQQEITRTKDNNVVVRLSAWDEYHGKKIKR